MIDVTSKLDRNRARKHLSEVLSKNPNFFSMSRHAREEMKKDKLIVNDILNVIKGGKILREPEQDSKTDHWKYRVETKRIGIVFRFTNYSQNDESNGIKVITCWRNKDVR